MSFKEPDAPEEVSQVVTKGRNASVSLLALYVAGHFAQAHCCSVISFAKAHLNPRVTWVLGWGQEVSGEQDRI